MEFSCAITIKLRFYHFPALLIHESYLDFVANGMIGLEWSLQNTAIFGRELRAAQYKEKGRANVKVLFHGYLLSTPLK
jgi:hypothetical protein